ncbi:uncharacterized protein [Neodiprion pinetum]|uniref:uncharacterized protein n=1 Tax=Neodiprion pinetum TaxID=441929 RepID=UPI001EDCD207|nr:uncharacterized protein LOC124221990 [Neodiprion pinetum]
MRRYLLTYFVLLTSSRQIFREIESSEGVEDREKRYLVYPKPGVGNAPTKVQLILGLGLPMEGGLIVGYVVKNNYNLPYNATSYLDPHVRYERSIYVEDSLKPDAEANRKGSTTRWETYRMLESAFNIFGSGKSCLLRAICEAAEGEPFGENYGLFGELLHLFLTPSSTAEEFLESTDQEYLAAESLGRRSLEKCRIFFPECEISPLEYFTESDD